MKISIKVLTIILILATAAGIASCGPAVINDQPAEATTEETTENPTTTENPATTESRPFDFKEEGLTWELRNVFTGDYVKNETVMFIDKGDTKELLYKIDKVISVTSYNGKKKYVEGEDYEVVDGKLRVTENSKIPCITSKKYYKGDGTLVVDVDGESKSVYWGEGTVMTNYQVNVEYTHSDTWNGYKQKCFAHIYDKLYAKLEAGEDVTVVFYGDSCTYGAASSFTYGYAPRQYSYALLVTNALADIFGYTVHYEKPTLEGTGPVPRKDYVAGERGTITYINNSVGGWTTSNGVSNFDKYAKPYIEKHGCDLFVVDLGGNDGDLAPEKTAENDRKIINKALELAPDAGVVIISTLLNRPGSNWAGNDALQEPYLVKLSEELRNSGVPCAVCGITSMTASVLEHIKFEDFSGNNINHPNDFWARLYANTLFETLIGYENLK
ncbi:MAG: SGNH/GDSL hydrolase family protein [Clostridia bacterium]|nr:SGNH/GDSL hydrolase family protein [Clostridia bacterium]